MYMFETVVVKVNGKFKKYNRIKTNWKNQHLYCTNKIPTAECRKS